MLFRYFSRLTLALSVAALFPVARVAAQQASAAAPAHTTTRAQAAPSHRTARTQDAASIEGRVTDPQGGGVAGAIVKLYARDERPATRLSTRTDESGAYRFERLPAPADYLVETEAEGFAQTGARAIHVRSGERVTLDLALALAGVRAEVVVTATDTPQTVDEVSKALSVVTRAEVDERDEPTVAEALRTVPGLRVQQLGGPGSLVSIRTRGLRTQDTSLLVDGLRLRDASAPQGDTTRFLSDLLVTNESRIEVLRGSGSSLYGTNAIGGVVNVITDEGGSPFHGNLLGEGGSLGQFRGRAQVAGGAGEANRLVYSAGLSHLNVTRGVDGDDAVRTTNAQGRLLFRLTPTATLSGRIYTGATRAQLNDEPQATGTLPAQGIVEAVPLAREELRRYEAGTPPSQLAMCAANFIPAANDPYNFPCSRFVG